MLLCVPVTCSFSFPSSIPLYGSTTACSFSSWGASGSWTVLGSYKYNYYKYLHTGWCVNIGSISLGKTLGIGLLGPRWIWAALYKKLPHHVPECLYRFDFLSELQLLCILPCTWYCQVFRIIVLLIGCLVIFHYGSDLHSPNDSRSEHLLMWLFAVHMVNEVSVQLFCSFKKWGCLCSYYWMVRVLYMFYTLYQICDFLLVCDFSFYSFNCLLRSRGSHCWWSSMWISG